MNTFNLSDAGTVRQVKLTQIVVPAYQRDVQRSAVWVAEDFRPFLLEPITVAPQVEPLQDDDHMLVDGASEDGTLYAVVDGLQRCTGMLNQFGADTQLLARTILANRTTQVDVFVRLNRSRVRVSEFWIFKANLADGDSDAIALNKVIEGHGFRVSKSANVNAIASIKQYQRLVSMDTGGSPTEAGLIALDKALATVTRMWLDTPDNRKRTNAAVVVGLARVYRDSVFKDGKGRGKSPEVSYVLSRLKKSANGTIRSLTPGDIINGANAERNDGASIGGGDQITTAASKFILEDLVNKHTSTNRLVWRD